MDEIFKAVDLAQKTYWMKCGEYLAVADEYIRIMDADIYAVGTFMQKECLERLKAAKTAHDAAVQAYYQSFELMKDKSH